MVMDTRQRIIERARELFTARSYHATGVQDICRAADVRKGSFYHFFESKHELALAVLDSSAELFSREVFTAAFEPDVPPLERIERFFELVSDYHDQARDEVSQIMGCPFANIAAEIDGADAALRDKVDGIFAFAEQYFRAALDEAVADGSLACNDTAGAASAMFAYAEGLILFAKTRNDAAIIRTLGRRAIRLATADTGADQS